MAVAAEMSALKRRGRKGGVIAERIVTGFFMAATMVGLVALAPS